MLLTRQQILRVVLNLTPWAGNGSDTAIAIVIKIFIRRESAGKIGGKPIRTKTRHLIAHTWPGEHELRRQTKTISRTRQNRATNGRAIVKNLDSAPVEAEDNVQKDPLESVGLENGLRIQQILARYRVRRIRNEGIE